MHTALDNRVLTFGSLRTYAVAALFAAGNIALPQLFHLVPMGGVTWLPIYFFTLVGAALYGWRAGLLTALASPLANALLFGMPAVALLPAIMLKSALLALFAGLAARRPQGVTLPALAAAVLGYQLLGTLGEWAMLGDLTAACRDLRIGLPGILLQIAGGYAVIRLLGRRAA